MADTINFELVVPTQLVADDPVEMVVVPLTEGDVGVLPGHSLLIGTLRPGTIDIHEGGKVAKSIFVAGGVCEVSPERCTVLAEEATPVADLDRAKADERLSAAKSAFDGAADDDKAQAEAELKTAEAMVAACAKAA